MTRQAADLLPHSLGRDWRRVSVALLGCVLAMSSCDGIPMVATSLCSQMLLLGIVLVGFEAARAAF